MWASGANGWFHHPFAKSTILFKTKTERFWKELVMTSKLLARTLWEKSGMPTESVNSELFLSFIVDFLSSFFPNVSWWATLLWSKPFEETSVLSSLFLQKVWGQQFRCWCTHQQAKLHVYSNYSPLIVPLSLRAVQVSCLADNFLKSKYDRNLVRSVP